MRKLSYTLLLFFPVILFAQKQHFPINISLFNEATGIPFTTFITTPIHPGLQVGTEFTYMTKTNSQLFQTLNLSYFYHNHLTQGIGINSELGYERKINRIAISALIGVGYLHTFAVAEEFSLINGKYVKKTDIGNARFMPSLSFIAGYNLFKNNIHSSQVFIRYQAWAEYPYSPGFIPIMTHNSLHLGFKFYLPIKENINE